jgi:hypothetical protein
MSAESTILAGRRFNESLMTASCSIGVATYVDDPDTLETTLTIDPVHYTGPCKVRFPGNVSVSQADAGGQLVAKQDAILSLPVEGSDDVAVDDRVLITACPMDPGLVGRTFRIAGSHEQTYATARRFPIEAVR